MRWSNEARLATAERFADHRIFVSVVAFRDRTLAGTIGRALDTADRPSQLRFGVCHLFDEATAGVLDRFADDPRVVATGVSFRDSRGAGWARARANGLFDSERYVLQIDAPAEFAHGWDRRLIDLLSSAASARPIITGRSPAIARSDGGAMLAGSLAGSAVELLPTTRLSAGELFAYGRFVRDVPADPEISVDAEDLALTLRAYTHGYDFLRPIEPAVQRLYSDVASLQAADASRPQASIDTMKRLRLGEDRDVGARGLGCLRTAAAYEDFVRRSLRSLSDDPVPDLR